MLACTDVQYRADKAVAACVLFKKWDAQYPAGRVVRHIQQVAPYEPGEFYKRELPCLLAVLAKVTIPLEAILIDGNVWLDGGRKGLGAHLYEALNGVVPVVGAAKTPFKDGAFAQQVLRGSSRKPLFVTAVGIPPQEAASLVQSMHGQHRLPTMVKLADRLARTR